MSGPAQTRSAAIVQYAMVAVLCAGSVWLGKLIYHNRYGHFASQAVASTVPDVVVTRDPAGKVVALRPAELRDPTLLLVLSVDCPFCEQNMPGWKELVAGLGTGGLSELDVLVLSTSDAESTAAYLRRHDLAVRSLHIDKAELRALGLRGVPGTVALSPGSEQLRFWPGVLSADDRGAILAWADAATVTAAVGSSSRDPS